MERIDYVHQYYPKMEQKYVDQNDLEIDYAINFDRNCTSCVGLDHCPNKTKGLHIIPSGVTPNGWIEWTFVNCKYLGDWRYVRK